MIGIIAAMVQEAADIKAAMEEIRSEVVAGMEFVIGKLYGREACVVMSGVGKVNAAICTQLLIDRFGAGVVINVGVAGAVATGLNVGDIVISSDTVQYDVDATAFGHPRGEIPNLDITYFPADETLIANALAAAAEVGQKAVVGRVMTADRGVDSPKLKAELIELFAGACVEMEGGAVGQTAWLNKVPYVVIRSMSDNADGELTETYAQNLDQSVKNAAAMVLAMVKADA